MGTGDRSQRMTENAFLYFDVFLSSLGDFETNKFCAGNI
jgi:hypothetical protein